MDYSHVSSNDDGAISKTDIVATYTYKELSIEFQRVYPIISRAIQLIGLMYNRLTTEEDLSHKEAISKIYEDHKHLQGFSQRNIRRSLLSLDNPNIPHRNRKIRPTWPNSDDAEAPIDVNDGENAEPSSESPAHNNELKQDLTRRAECSNCRVLLLQCQGLEKERSKVVEHYEQALQIIKEQQDSNQLVINKDIKILEQEIALLYGPLQQTMASAFKLKENSLWLTLKLSRNTGDIIAVYTGRKSNRAHQSQSILSNQNRVNVLS